MNRRPHPFIYLLFAVVFLAAITSGCGDDGGAREAAEQMLQASKDGDCERAASYIDLDEAVAELGIEITLDDLVEACKAEKEVSPLVDYKILGETDVEDGVEVEVEITNKVDGEEVKTEDTIMLKEIDGEWKIVP